MAHWKRHTTTMAAVLGFLLLGVTWAFAQENGSVPAESTLPEVVVTPGESEEPTPNAGSYDGRPGLYDFPFSTAVADGYLATSATTGTKIAVGLIDFPGSVGIITRNVMDDQEATDLFDVVHNVSNVYQDHGAGGVNDKFIIRGFEIDGNDSDFRKNGFRDASRTQRDLANVERVEILKGPASVLYGADTNAAGIINFITKRPLEHYYRLARAQFGYWDNYRFTFDTTGPVNQQRNSFYRLNMAVQDAGSFRDFVFKDRFFIAPVVAFQLDSCTTLTFETEWLHDYRVPDRGLPLVDGSFQAVPISRYLGEPDNFSRVDDGQFGIFLERRTDANLAWRVGYVSNWSEESRDVVETRGTSLVGTEVRRQVRDSHTLDSNHYFIGDLTSDFSTGWLQHELVLGTELGTDIRHKDELSGNATNLDIFNPVYGLPQPTPTRLRQADIQNDQYGIYLQDLIEVAPRLKALAGVRWDAYQGHSFDTRSTPNTITTNDDVWSPRFGLVYQPLSEVFSIYAGYSKSFQPQVGISRLGSPFVPAIGDLYEVGTKLELFEGRVLMTVAGFDTFRNDVLVTDPIDPDFDVQVGEIESKGVEFDLVGQITNRWSILANCGYTDARITRDTDAVQIGNRLPNVPYFGASVWTRYNLVQSCEKTVGVATGMIYRGQRQGDIDNSYQLPGYARWDAAVYYRCRRVEFSLVAENLLDKFYIASSRNALENMPGAPVSLMGSARILF